MYQTGTLVLYYRRGVYRVESTGAPPFREDDGQVYYKLRPAFSGNTEIIYIPVETAGVMRPLISKAEAMDYLALYPELKPQILHSRKTAELIGHYRDMLTSNRVEDCLLLIKELCVKQRDLASHNKKLGQIDQQYQKAAERLVCEEFAAVLSTDPDSIRKRLYTAVRSKVTA